MLGRTSGVASLVYSERSSKKGRGAYKLQKYFCGEKERERTTERGKTPCLPDTRAFALNRAQKEEPRATRQ